MQGSNSPDDPDWAERFGGVSVLATFYRCIRCLRQQRLEGQRNTPDPLICVKCSLAV